MDPPGDEVVAPEPVPEGDEVEVVPLQDVVKNHTVTEPPPQPPVEDEEEVPTILSDYTTTSDESSRLEVIDSSDGTGTDGDRAGSRDKKKKIHILASNNSSLDNPAVYTDTSSSSPAFDSDEWIEVKMSDVIEEHDNPSTEHKFADEIRKEEKKKKEEKRKREKRRRMSSKERNERELMERGRREMERTIEDLQLHARVSKTVQLDVVELLKQVLQWTPLYKPGLNKALLQAAKIGSSGCVKVLLTAGADVDTEDDNGDTPFVHAFRGHHQDVMEVLYESGCQTEIAKMSLALATKDPRFVRLCHRLEIPVENEDWNSGDADEVRLLLDELKLDPFEGQYGRHGFEDSPFMYLAQEGSPEILEMLVSGHPCIEKYTVDDKQEKLNRALLKAVHHHRLDNIRLLLGSLGAKLEATDAMGRSAFILACGLDQPIANDLLERGANTQVSDREGLTPLHWAACAGFKQLCADLLDRGHDINIRAKLGATPLMVACSSRHHDICEFFLGRGCQVNVATPEGWTALHVAVRACAPKIVKLLLAYDANPDVQSSRLTHNSDIVPASTPLLIAIALNSMKTMRHLVDANCDLDSAAFVCTNPSLSSSESEEESRIYEKQKCTPLQYAIISRAWDIAALLIKAGGNVSVTVRKWLMEEGRAPVNIPTEKRRYLQILLNNATSCPPKLKFIVRRRLRQVLGRHMLAKLDIMQLPSQAKTFILMHELFRPSEGSFEV